jgi:hypothetical protein
MKQDKEVSRSQGQQLNSWQEQQMGAAAGLDGGVIPDDIRAIYQKMRSGGMPTEAARPATQSNGPHGTATDNLMRGRVTVKTEVELVALIDAKCDP